MQVAFGLTPPGDFGNRKKSHGGLEVMKIRLLALVMTSMIGYASRNCATLAGHTVPLLSLRLPIATMPFLDEFAGRNCAN